MDRRLSVGGDPFGTHSRQARVRLACCHWNYTNLLRPWHNRIRGRNLARCHSGWRCHISQLTGVIVARVRAPHLHIGAIPAPSVATPATPNNDTDHDDPLPTRGARRQAGTSGKGAIVSVGHERNGEDGGASALTTQNPITPPVSSRSTLTHFIQLCICKELLGEFGHS